MSHLLDTILITAWMRFKGRGCAYSDSETWFTKELIAYNRESGFLPGSSGVSSDLTSFLYHEHKNRGGCVEKAGPWAMFEVSLTFGHEWFHFDWFNSELRTEDLFKLSARFTATSNSDPSSATANWIELKTSFNDFLCMDVAGSSTHNGNYVQLYHCNGSGAQKWYMDGIGRIRSKVNINKCLSAGSGVNKWAKMHIWDCADAIHQKWEFTLDRKIRSKKNGRIIGVAYGCDGVSQGDRLEMQDDFPTGNCKRQQQWLSWPPTFGHIEIDLNRNLCIDLAGSGTHNGNYVQLYPCNHSNAQKWFMDDLGRIHSAVDVNKCLEAGSGVYKYARMKIWDCHDGIWQQWELTSDKKIRSKKNGRYISVAHGCDGVSREDRLEMQDEHTGAGSCARQQKWHFAGYY